MPVAQPAALRWSVDSFLISQGVLFSYGWLVLGAAAAEELQLEVRYADGSEECLPVETGLDRPDVAASIPGAPRHSGFLVFFAVADKPIATVYLRVLRIKGAQGFALELSSVLLVNHLGVPRNLSSAVFSSLARKTLEHLRNRQFRVLWQKALRILPSLRSERLGREALLDLLDRCPKNTALIVDHRLGGGANLYRERLIRTLAAAERTTVLLSFEPSSLRYHLKFYLAEADPLEVSVAPDVWFALAAARCFSTVYFNNCVSFPSPERVPEMLVHLVRSTGARLVVFMHDHYSLCPSHFLLNASGRYCGLPAVEECRNCLPKIRDGLVSFYRARDIDDWRCRWLECLKSAGEIVCFAESGKEALLKVYPELSGQEIRICPHEIESDFGGLYVPPSSRSPIRVAVVGSINGHKGSEVVTALARTIERREAPVSIHVIGSLTAAEKPRCITETGPYQREDLPRLIRDSGVHLALMPSICPETFSFVTHELISIGIPVMTFDMGGQAEAARKAPNCRVVPLLDPDALLDAVLDFAREQTVKPATSDSLTS